MLASLRLAIDALECYEADERADNQHRVVFLKEMSDRDYEKAPKDLHVPVCFVIDNAAVLVAYHVTATSARTRPYLMICHLYVARGCRHQGHATLMLHMFKEYALANQVSIIRLTSASVPGHS